MFSRVRLVLVCARHRYEIGRACFSLLRIIHYRAMFTCTNLERKLSCARSVKLFMNLFKADLVERLFIFCDGYLNA